MGTGELAWLSQVLVMMMCMEAGMLTAEEVAEEPPHVPVPEGRPVEELVADLCGLINAAHGELVGVIAGVVESGSWTGYGIRSVEHWVTLHCGVSAARARQLVAVARGLADRPVTREAFETGRLSVEQVAPICRDVPPAYEASAAELAQSATVGQITRVCSKYAFPDDGAGGDSGDGDADDRNAPPASAPTREVGFGSGHGDTWWLSARFGTLEGAELEKALTAARDRLFNAGHTGVTWADAVVEVCRAYLGGETVTLADRYQVVVHLSAENLQTARLHLGSRLPHGVASRLLCDTTIRALIDADGRPVGLSARTRTIPHWLRMLVEDRDGACRVPGCERTRWLEIHHVVPAAEGGDTVPDNLIALCTTHHDAHHRGEIVIAGDAREVAFTNRHGVAIGPRPPTPSDPPPLQAGRDLGIDGTYRGPSGEPLQGKWVYLARAGHDPPRPRVPSTATTPGQLTQ